jgi:hypothetical protein
MDYCRVIGIVASGIRLISDRNIGAVAAAGIGPGACGDVTASIAAAGIGIESARNIGGGIALRIGALAKRNIGAAVLTDDTAARIRAGSRRNIVAAMAGGVRAGPGGEIIA